MSTKEIECTYCKSKVKKEAGAINRAIRDGKKMYCNRKCAGLSKRKNKSDKVKREDKRLYDIDYRKKNRERIKRNKANWFKSTYDPVKAAEKRRVDKANNPERELARRKYMASDKYKRAKKVYDRTYKSINRYGHQWGPCHVLALDIRDECLQQASDIEIRLAAKTLNKSQNRKRHYEKLNRAKSKNSPMANLK